MLSRRALCFSVLSVSCIAIFLYYTIIPQGPRLFHWKESKGTASDAKDEMANSTFSAYEKVTKAERFTAEIFLSVPRRTSAIPNHDGTLAVFGVATYSFESRRKHLEVRVMDIETGQSQLIISDDKTGSPNWIGKENELIWFRVGEKGTTEVRIGDANAPGRSYVAGVVPGSVADVKLKTLDDDTVAIALTAAAKPDGTMYNQELETENPSSALIYDSLMVRHWDRYVTKNRNAIFHGLLHRGKAHVTESRGKYTLGDLTNVLHGTDLESPVPTFGSTDNFDLSERGVGFIAKDPELDPATNTKSNFYHVLIERTPQGLKYSPPVIIKVKDLEGASTSPSLEPNGGEGAAFFQMKTNGYESDKNRIVLVADVTKPDSAFEIIQNYDGTGLWDRSPDSIMWSNNGRRLFVTAEEEARVKIFKIDIPDSPMSMNLLPIPLTKSGSISDAHNLGTESTKLFVSKSSLTDNSAYYIIDPDDPNTGERLVSSNSHNGTFFGMSEDQISEIHWQGGYPDQKIQAWVVNPPDFDPSKRYPLAYLVHGGPQGAWGDSWSTRWNPFVIADQGYVVVLPNPTGSTGFGQAFTDAIAGQWGGLPYQDLVAGFDFIESNLTYVDTTRAVALGGSFGGYMMNWIQGQELGKKFKALVCHDGSFNLPGQTATDELYFPNHDFGGRLDNTTVTDPDGFGNGGGDARAKWERWNPVNHISNWTTPMLVVHSANDYRLPISEGLAMFNVLQQRGIESRFLTFPDENHWVSREENSLVWYTVVLNWINKHVGLEPYRDEEVLRPYIQH